MAKQSSKRSAAARKGDSKPARASSAPAEASLAPDATLVKVVLIFVAIVAVLETAGWFASNAGFFTPVCRATATTTGVLSNLTGVHATVTGVDILLATRTLRIDVDCTGASLMIIYTALVLAYPLSAKRKAIGLLIGLPVIAVANFARLVAVAQLSGPLGDRTFRFMHDYLFQVAMLGVVIVLWSLYLASARRHAS